MASKQGIENNMKLSSLLLVIALSAVTAFGVTKYAAAPTGSATEAKKETAFERVLRTGTLRCGYYVFPPVVMRDPNTGKMSGFSVDMMEKVAERSGLKVEWAEEVTFGNWVPALQTKRFDAVCTPMWPEITLAKAVAFTEPMFYAGLSPVVRTNDDRFKGNDLERINQPDVTFLTQDGNATDTLAREAFPKAKFYTLAAGVDGSQYYQSILAKKADTALTDRNAVSQYKKTNGDVLRLVAPDKPVKVQSFSLVVEREEMLLKDFLDLSIRELNNTGSIDRMLKKWEDEPGKTYLRVAPPYANLRAPQ
jgi:ABC-type amino acid transport substrate-binding protein